MGKTYEFEQVVTRTGDGGKSTDYSGKKYSKDDLIFETLGNIDELSSWLGKICHHPYLSNFEKTLSKMQLILQHGMSQVATNPWNSYTMKGSGPTNPVYLALEKVEEKHILWVEDEIKKILSGGVQIKNGFILPGGSPESADIDIARTVCRRAERSIVRFMQNLEDRWDLTITSRFLNRLSDWLFVFARSVEQRK